ncbi:hypothetical protein DFH09DRAFT_260003 [Mycena vulgaris]|nr:hypothetical protein DFH09DRAFT_260003 [Mycena vulgaris]
MLITRKLPLLAACAELDLVVPKTATLSRLRDALADRWFRPSAALSATQPASTSSAIQSAARRNPAPAARQRATDAHDVLASALNSNPAPITIIAPSGSRQRIATEANRGELSGGIPLLLTTTSRPPPPPRLLRQTQQAGAPSQPPRQTEHQARASSSRIPQPLPLTGPRPNSSLASTQTTALPRSVATLHSSPPQTPPSQGPSQRRLNSTAPRVSSPLWSTPTQEQHQNHPESPLIDIPAVAEEGDAEEAALLRAFDVPGSNAYEILSYEDEEEEDEEFRDLDEEESDDVDDLDAAAGGNSGSDDLVAAPQRARQRVASGDQEEFRIGVRVAAVRRTEGN